MNPKKIILRRYSPEPGQLAVKINYLIVEKSMGNPRLAPMAAAYKAFKVENPQRAARLPSAIKAQAWDLYDSGSATIDEIAEACGLTGASVRAWFGRLKEGDGAVKAKRPSPRIGSTAPLEKNQVALPVGDATKAILLARSEVKPADAKKSVVVADTNWIRIRVQTTELEVHAEDFLKLLTLGLG